MSCPDWRRLAAHRRAAPGTPGAEEPEAWPAALDHLDGCSDCRRRAVAEDPLLVFRRLPAVEAGPDSVAAMRAGVAALRRAHRVEGGRAPADLDAGRLGRWWGRVAAAAVLAAALLAVAPAAERTRNAGNAAVEVQARYGGPALGWTPTGFLPAAFLDDPGLPAVDDIEHPTASVYHFDDEDVELVMVVDAGLDV